MTASIALLLLIVAAAGVALLAGRLRPDLVALLVLVLLGLAGLTPPADLFSGFSRTAVITILALFVITAALERTGATRFVGQWLGRAAGASEARQVLMVMAAAAALALVMTTIAATAVLLPVVIGLARRARRRPSRLLMPLAFGALLGGLVTLFTPANILVSSALVDAGYRPYSVLDFVPVGLPMAVAGIVYMTVWSRRRLPDRALWGRDGERDGERAGEPDSAGDRPGGTLTEAYGLQAAVSAAYVKPGSALAGLSLHAGEWGRKLGLMVVGISRGGVVNLAPRAADEVLAGDLILFTGTTDDEELARFGLKLTADPAWSGQLASDAVSLVEVTLAPRSAFAGATLRELRFGEKYDLRALALWRAGQTVREAVAEMPLRFGDALLLQGRRSKLALLRDEPGLIVLEEDGGPLRLSRRALLALAVTAAAVGLAAANVLPLAEATFAAAVTLLLTGCLQMEEAYRAIEWRVIFLIAGLLPLSLAMTSTGTAALLGAALAGALGAWGPLALAGGLFVIAALLTQVFSAPITPLVLAPVAIAAAQRLGADPRALALAVALGCSTAFLTPLSQPGSLLVMGPGGYTFRDYGRVGAPLTLLLFGVMLAGLALWWGVR
ncbi:MAG: SLC13 family permease [Anaerolineales bacterium]|nr:SLC13 family permease [Anaerolineales bacterium]